MTGAQFRLGVTLHSFATEYASLAWSLEDLMVMAAKLGGGVEIVGPSHQRGFPYVTDEFEALFKSSVERNGLTPTAYGSYADPFMLPSRDLSPSEIVDYSLPQIYGAKRLGFPVVRLQHFTAEVIDDLLPIAERLGIKLGWELHVPLTLESERTQFLLSLVRSRSSEYLGIIPDAGIFARAVSPRFIEEGVASGVPRDIAEKCTQAWYAMASLEEVLALAGDPEPQSITGSWIGYVWDTVGHSDPAGLVEVMPWVNHVHGKFFEIVAGDEPNLRYAELVVALVQGGYGGWISSEYEGPGPNSFLQVQAHQRMIENLARAIPA